MISRVIINVSESVPFQNKNPFLIFKAYQCELYHAYHYHTDYRFFADLLIFRESTCSCSYRRNFELFRRPYLQFFEILSYQWLNDKRSISVIQPETQKIKNMGGQLYLVKFFDSKYAPDSTLGSYLIRW